MADPLIQDLLEKARRPLLSLEFFPPRDEQGFEHLRRAAADLMAARPDFVTVTYGAGGSTRTRTLEVCDELRRIGFGVVMPHLTCAGHGRAELEAIVDDWHRRSYRNVMALRGDPPAGADAFVPPPGGLDHASDLVGLIRDRHADVCCGVAGYPELHPESRSAEMDTIHLKRKVMAGAAFVTTQLFYNNAVYAAFVERCRRAGIYQPILPGLLPAVSLEQVRRIARMCRAGLPGQLEVDLQDAGGKGPAAEAVGIRWAASQIRNLLEGGAPGVHLYILNRSRTALAPELIRCLKPYR